MENTTLTHINKIIKDSYIKQKEKNATQYDLSWQMYNAWEFIDNLFILEMESDDSDYYAILDFLIPLMKPASEAEKRSVFMEYLNLIGISLHHDHFKMIMDFYDLSNASSHSHFVEY